MKKKLPFDKAVPPTSERFHLAMEYALDHLKEEENVKRTTKMSLGMALALILALALMATAFALTNGFGILEYFTRRADTSAPLESAQALVQSNLGSAEAYGYRLSVSEAVYTGPNVLLMADVTVPEYGTDVHSVSFDFGREGLSGAGRGDLEYTDVAIDFIEDDLPEGVTFRVFWEILILEEPPEAVEVSIGVDIDIRENTLSEPRPVGDRAISDELLVNVVLRQTQDARSTAFSADAAAAADAGLEILSMRAQYTDLEAVVAIEYAIQGDEAQGVFYGTPHGTFFHADPTCSGMKNAVQLDSTEGKTPCPVCVTNDSPSSADGQYVAEGSPYIHRDPSCDLLEGLEPRAPQDSVLGMQPCPHCWGLERRVRFHALGGNGEEFSAGDIPLVDVAYAVDAQGRILRRQILRMQTSEEIPAVLLLRVVESNNDGLADLLEGASGEVLYAPIRCERQE